MDDGCLDWVSNVSNGLEADTQPVVFCTRIGPSADVDEWQVSGAQKLIEGDARDRSLTPDGLVPYAEVENAKIATRKLPFKYHQPSALK
ncbi:MAG: hypothetical protein ACR2I0_08045, partial [Rhodoferax sp.]